MLYEVYLTSGYSSSEIEANSAKEARELFAEILRESVEAEHVEANNLDTEDGRDPE